MASILDRVKNAWNAFSSAVPMQSQWSEGGTSYSSRPDRARFNLSNERSIIASIYTRIGIDVASIDIFHVRLDEDKRYLEEIDSGLNQCLNIEANIDQGARHFKQDMAMSLLDKGTIAIVPVDTNINPDSTGSVDIYTMRIGEIVGWSAEHVMISLYNDRIGRRQDIRMPKARVGIVENPLFAVMNEPNSTLQRLVRKLNILDAIDEQSGSGKLDIIIQLPYVVKSDARRQQAAQRRTDLELQLKNSKYGVGYVDATEKITQLNRPAENNLLKQVEWLTEMLYGQLGLTPQVINGTADEKEMLNYHNRTIEPILAAIRDELKRKFLTKTARTQGQSIEYFRDPFRLVPVSELAEIADKFTRNEILTSNEFRGVIGRKPVKDARADELRNKNIPEAVEEPKDVGELKQLKPKPNELEPPKEPRKE